MSFFGRGNNQFKKLFRKLLQNTIILTCILSFKIGLGIRLGKIICVCFRVYFAPGFYTPNQNYFYPLTEAMNVLLSVSVTQVYTPI